MADIPEDYFEQFSAFDREEALPKIQAAALRSKEKGCTFPEVSIFPEHKIEAGPDAGKTLYAFRAWKVQPRLPDTCTPPHIALVPQA